MEKEKSQRDKMAPGQQALTTILRKTINIYLKTVAIRGRDV